MHVNRFSCPSAAPRVKVQDAMVSAATNITEFVQETFGDLANDSNARTVAALAGKAILTPLCDDVDHVNKIVTNLWPGEVWGTFMLLNILKCPLECTFTHSN